MVASVKFGIRRRILVIISPATLTTLIGHLRGEEKSFAKGNLFDKSFTPSMKSDFKIRTFRYGDPSKRGEGLRIGTTRRPPRGIKKPEWSEFFDVWYPILAPSASLLKRFRNSVSMDYGKFCASYERELLGKSEARQALQLLAAVSLRIPISIGCFCEDESVCHRSHLHKLMEQEVRSLVKKGKRK
jgi:uncharacterized protein YeaO (DUF488 family)